MAKKRRTFKNDEERLAARRQSLVKSSRKYRKKNRDSIRELDRERKNKKYSEDVKFRSEIKERTRLARKSRKFTDRLDEDA